MSYMDAAKTRNFAKNYGVRIPISVLHICSEGCYLFPHLLPLQELKEVYLSPSKSRVAVAEEV